MLFCIFKFCLILNYSNSRGVFRTQSNIYDGAFCKNSWRFSAVNYFHKNLHLRYSTGLSIRVWIASFSEYFAFQGAFQSTFMLLFSSFMPFLSSLFLKFWVSCRDIRKFNKVEVGNLKFYYFCYVQMLFLIIRLTAFTTYKICSKPNTLCCNYVHFSKQSSFLSLKKISSSSLLNNNIHVPTEDNLFVPTKIKFLMIKLITNAVWKTCWDFLTAI